MADTGEEVLFQGATDLRRHPFLINGITRLVEFAERQGIAREAILAGTGIRPADLYSAQILVSARQESRAVENLLRHFHDPHPGLRVGQCFRLSVVGLLGSAIPHCATAADAMGFFMDHIGLSYTHFMVDVTRRNDCYRLNFREQYSLGDLYRFFLERDMVFTVQAIRDVAGEGAEALVHEIRWPFRDQGEKALLEEVLGYPVRLGADQAAIVGPIEALSMPLPQADAITLSLLAEQCERLEEKLASRTQTRDRVWRLLITETPLPDMETVARRLNMTTRTLRRKLDGEGINFRDLRQAALQSRALGLLRQSGTPLASIAEAMGYSEPSSFIHAFRRATGDTPARYRRQLVS